jgi:DNA-binding NtrC family response regulator
MGGEKNESLKNLAVLVVDDEPLVLRATSRALMAVDASHVHLARSLDAAIGTVASSVVDAAVVDLNIGATSGLAVAAALRRMRPGLPVVLMTGGARPDDLCGAVYLMKPFSPGELAEAVQHAMSDLERTG